MPSDETTTPPDTSAQDPVTPAPEPETTVSGDSPAPADSAPTAPILRPDLPSGAPESPTSDVTPGAVKDGNLAPETPMGQAENGQNTGVGGAAETAPESAPSSNFFRDLLLRARSRIQERKARKLDRIMDLFAKHTPSEIKTQSHGARRITNDEVRELLHVSRQSATRYLDILEKQGKIRQTGKVGHAVFYILN